MRDHPALRRMPRVETNQQKAVAGACTLTGARIRGTTINEVSGLLKDIVPYGRKADFNVNPALTVSNRPGPGAWRMTCRTSGPPCGSMSF